MRSLSAADLLAVWERGLNLGPLQRALSLLAAAFPGETPEALAQLSVGRRDAFLLALRELTFGPQMESVVQCPRCAEKIELAFGTADVCAESAESDSENIAVSVAGFEISLRVPNSIDLAAVASRPGSEEASRMLFDRCLSSAAHAGVPTRALPVEVMNAAVARMAEVDPQADVQLPVTCPACGHEWRAVFDIVSFFWAEIEIWARRLLNEVHLLASAYGWSECDILRLSPLRRQFYLEAVRT